MWKESTKETTFSLGSESCGSIGKQIDEIRGGTEKQQEHKKNQLKTITLNVI